jgi:hypothetical protein
MEPLLYEYAPERQSDKQHRSSWVAEGFPLKDLLR